MILLGHNGAGKSTLINFLLGFYPSIASHPYLAKLSKDVPSVELSSVGYAPEAALLDGGLSAEDYFGLLAKNKKISGYSVSEELSKVGLNIDKKLKINKYSKGMKQRLLLALALFGNPKTVILDEPTSGLDPFGKEEIEAYLLGLKDDRDFIISTHSLEFAYRFGIEIWILKEGAVVYRGIPSSLEELQRLFFDNRPKGVA
jgi:ABC-type multidrug transport system ATPase subunit